jgi:hypothetical protein
MTPRQTHERVGSNLVADGQVEIFKTVLITVSTDESGRNDMDANVGAGDVDGHGRSKERVGGTVNRRNRAPLRAG